MVMGAVEKASLEFARKKLEEERRRAEEERKRAEEEAKRKAEEERHRLEAEQALLEERKKLEAERQALEERRKGLEGSQRPPVVAAVPPAETVDDPRDVAARTLKEIIKENENASGLLISRGLMHSYGGRGHFLELVELTSNYMVTAQIVGDHPKMTAHFGDIEKVRFNASSFFSSPYVELVFRNSSLLCGFAICKDHTIVLHVRSKEELAEVRTALETLLGQQLPDFKWKVID